MQKTITIMKLCYRRVHYLTKIYSKGYKRYQWSKLKHSDLRQRKMILDEVSEMVSIMLGNQHFDR